ncbi:Major Facilitator Superfamily protein [Acanthocheilonema viteae]
MDTHRRPVGIISRIIRFLIGDEIWTSCHFVVFSFTFISYALVHASRKTLSTVKPSLINEWTDNSTGEQPLFPDKHTAEGFLAFLDGAFLGAYALGLYVGGTLGDRYNPTKVLALGMWSSSTTVFLFGMLKWSVFRSPVYYAATWIACGLFQSVAWPTEISIMGNWFGHNSRGAVMGLWSACASVGNIMGTLVSSYTVQLGYEYSFIANACSLFLGGFFIFYLLPSRNRHERDAVISISNDLGRPKAISFWQAWRLPGVFAYSLAYACLKLVNYSFFFWLPFYLHAHYGWKESIADELSAWYDIGGIVAAVIAGIASDHFSSRTPVLVCMLIFSMGSLFAYANSPDNVLINSFLMALTGFFIGGPANLISSAVSADLGKAEQIRGSSEALSTVTGIIDGTGSVGAGIGQLFIPEIEAVFGWTAVFYGFIVMMLCTILCLTPLLWKEIANRRNPRYVHLHSEDSNDSLGSYFDSAADSAMDTSQLP